MKDRRHPPGWIAAVLCGLVANGCASSDKRQHSPEMGWRPAIVTQVGDDLPAVTVAGNDCRRIGDPGVRDRYAEVMVREHRRLLHRIVLLPGDGAFASGDDVYVNLIDCRLALARRGSI